jgi:hypothetical protein
MTELKNMSELTDEYRQYREELDRACHINGDKIVFDVKGLTDYEIPLARCDTYEKIVSWTTHLAEKDWVTVDILRHFISLACSHHDLDAHGHC